MSLKNKTWLVDAVIGAGFLLAVFGGGGARKVFGLVLLFAGFALDFALLRCPHCGVWLGRYSGGYCKSCGGEIDNDAKSGS